MAFKVFIVLLWLTVPAGLSVLLRTDMQNFALESKQQARSCDDRREAIGSSSATLMQHGRQLEFCRTHDALRKWQGTWRSAVRFKDSQLQRYAGSRTDHYPATGAMLARQEQKLNELANGLTEAARDQEYYLRGEEVLAQMEYDLEVVAQQSDFYRRMPGGRGIYLYLQEELAKQESRFTVQRKESTRLLEAVRSRVLAAGQANVELQAELGTISKLLAQDSSQGYWDHIRQRWQDFDLREQLVQLLSQLAGQAA